MAFQVSLFLEKENPATCGNSCCHHVWLFQFWERAKVKVLQGLSRTIQVSDLVSFLTLSGPDKHSGFQRVSGNHLPS